MMDQTPEPPEHERGQSVLEAHTNRMIQEGTDVIRLSLGYLVDASGDVRIADRHAELPEGAHWLEDEQLPDESNGVK